MRGTLHPSQVMNPHEFVHMMEEAEAVMDVLEYKKQQVIDYKESLTKKITCVWCGHNGRSMVVNSQPWITLIMLVCLYFATNLIVTLLLSPFVLGIMRK